MGGCSLLPHLLASAHLVSPRTSFLLFRQIDFFSEFTCHPLSTTAAIYVHTRISVHNPFPASPPPPPAARRSLYFHYSARLRHPYFQLRDLKKNTLLIRSLNASAKMKALPPLLSKEKKRAIGGGATQPHNGALCHMTIQVPAKSDRHSAQAAVKRRRKSGSAGTSDAFSSSRRVRHRCRQEHIRMYEMRALRCR